MAKGKYLTPDETKIIEEEYRHDTDIQGKALRYAVNNRNYRNLALSTVQRELTKLREEDRKKRETLRVISETASNDPSTMRVYGFVPSPNYWELGHMMDTRLKIPAEVLPVILKVQKIIKDELGLTIIPKIPVSVAVWISSLYTLVPEPANLFLVAYAYAEFEDINIRAGIEIVDTIQLDQLLAFGDIPALIGLATGLKDLKSRKEEDPKNILDAAIRYINKSLKIHNSMEAQNERTHNK
jgi:hypothetical protein